MADSTIQIDISLTGDAEAKVKAVNAAVTELGTKGSDSLDKLGRISETAFGVFTGEALLHAVEAVASAFLDWAKEGLTRSVELAIEEEDAINKLNFALSASGNYTEQASKAMVDFATSQAESTKFTKDQVISAEALISSLAQLGGTTLIKATQAAEDLATVLGGDLESAAMKMARAAEGNTTALARLGINIVSTGNQATDLKNIIAAVEGKWHDAAVAAGQTFSGALAILQHQMDEGRKSTGDAIIANQSLVNVIRVATDILKEFQAATSKNKAMLQEWISDAVIIAIEALQTLANGAQAVYVGFLKIEQGAYAAWFELARLTNAITFGFTNAGKDADEAEAKFNKLGTSITNASNNKPMEALNASLDRLKKAAVDGYGKINDAASRHLDLTNSSTSSVAALTKQMQALIAEGVKLSTTLGNQADPTKEFDQRTKALQAALKAQQIGIFDYQTAYLQAEKEMTTKLGSEVKKRADTVLQENDALLAKTGQVDQAKVLSNVEALKTISQDETLSAKDRAEIQTKYTQQSIQIEQLRAQGITDSLNALSTLQSAKTAEIAAIGKAAAIAQATIDTYRGASAASAAVAGIPGIGPVLAVAAAAAFIASGLFRVAQIAGVPLATGITEVPPGFGNDTFPARLSSGERVVDSGTNQDLKGFLGGADSMIPLLAQISSKLDNLQSHTVVNIGNKTIMDEVRDGLRSGRTLNV